ncbi:MAG: metal ABC transporter permease [Treponema sp.]|jgi:zinc transport system permease protein|nr:metal ABC transporter permease [Treponema sp.]
MTDFAGALLDPGFPFLRNALLAGLLSSVLFGCLGSIVTVRRIASLAGAVSHAVLGGIGMALYLSASNLVPGFPPMAGAFIFAVLSALIIGIVSLRAKQRAIFPGAWRG